MRKTALPPAYPEILSQQTTSVNRIVLVYYYAWSGEIGRGGVTVGKWTAASIFKD